MAGNLLDPAAQLIVLAAVGVMSAVAINVDHFTEDTELAMVAERESQAVSA